MNKNKKLETITEAAGEAEHSITAPADGHRQWATMEITSPKADSESSSKKVLSPSAQVPKLDLAPENLQKKKAERI